VRIKTGDICPPQWITEVEDITVPLEVLWRLTIEEGESDFVLGFNSDEGGGNSSRHRHSQLLRIKFSSII
jgi:hypothetical protein